MERMLVVVVQKMLGVLLVPAFKLCEAAQPLCASQALGSG